MATITSTPTTSNLKVSGTTQVSGTVSFSNLVYTVTYEVPKPTYTVTFVDWNGTVLKTETVEEGASATAPSNPTRDGYTFVGWDKGFTNITSNLEVIAQYEENKTSVNINIGTTSLSKVYIGDKEIIGIYLGDKRIF